LPFGDDSFDCIAASFVMHYVADWSPVLVDFALVLRASGRIFLTTHHPLRDVLLAPKVRYRATELVEETWMLSGHGHVVQFWRRPLDAMSRSFVDASLVINRIVEPPENPGGAVPRLVGSRLVHSPRTSTGR
jgi:SAM-dependent methyltransferase